MRALAPASGVVPLLDYLGDVGPDHLRIVHAWVDYFLSEDDLVSDAETGGFDDDAETLNGVLVHFGRGNLKVRLDIGI